MEKGPQFNEGDNPLTASGMTPEEQQFAKVREEHMARMAQKLGNQVYDPEWHHTNFHNHFSRFSEHELKHEAAPHKGYDKIADEAWEYANAFAGTYHDVTGKPLVDDEKGLCNHCGMKLWGE